VRPAKVDPLKKQLKLDGIDLDSHRIGGVARQVEASTLETFEDEREAAARPKEHLGAIAAPIEEDEEVTGERIGSEHLPDEQRQAVKSTSEIDGRRRDEDAQA